VVQLKKLIKKLKIIKLKKYIKKKRKKKIRGVAPLATMGVVGPPPRMKMKKFFFLRMGFGPWGWPNHHCLIIFNFLINF
jgi:hypothetical protein